MLWPHLQLWKPSCPTLSLSPQPVPLIAVSPEGLGMWPSGRALALHMEGLGLVPDTTELSKYNNICRTREVEQSLRHFADDCSLNNGLNMTPYMPASLAKMAGKGRGIETRPDSAETARR